jgi:hypothetical protein
MNRLDGIRRMAASHKDKTGRKPGVIRVGKTVACELAMELSISPMTDGWHTSQEMFDRLSSGKAKLFGLQVEVCDSVFPTAAQIDAIDGYRQVGPC